MLYKKLDAEVKNSARKDKRIQREKILESEKAAIQNNVKTLYDTTRKLAGNLLEENGCC